MSTSTPVALSLACTGRLGALSLVDGGVSIQTIISEPAGTPRSSQEWLVASSGAVFRDGQQVLEPVPGWGSGTIRQQAEAVFDALVGAGLISG